MRAGKSDKQTHTHTRYADNIYLHFLSEYWSSLGSCVMGFRSLARH